MSSPHILAIPFPAQGHVIPLLELSQCLVKHGCRVTFVNTEYNHNRVVNALEENHFIGDRIHLVSIPDGMEAWEDRNHIDKLCVSVARAMPGKLEELIKKINTSESDKIACVIADGTIGWAMELAKKMNIRRAVFWPAAAASMALLLSTQKLIDNGIINNDGTVMKREMVQLAPNMPTTDSAHFIWACIGDSAAQKVIFDRIIKNNEAPKIAETMVCNTTDELEPAALSLVPGMLPIGPLLASNRLGNSAGCFWKEDQTCLKWLDQQPANSVIYVAFGSHTLFDQTQFRELALGLELSNRPFLWVVRLDFTKDTSDAYPEGFLDRVATRGRVVNWAPQQKVLSHPSMACFLSHCGWNSTMEGVSNGLPFLCWPYFADQFLNESYICDIWKVGLRFNRNETGIITRTEIKTKLDQLLSDKNFRARSLTLKEMTRTSVKEGGHSNKNFKNFIEWIKT